MFVAANKIHWFQFSFVFGIYSGRTLMTFVDLYDGGKSERREYEGVRGCIQNYWLK
jgi:hypothetical protein